MDTEGRIRQTQARPVNTEPWPGPGISDERRTEIMEELQCMLDNMEVKVKLLGTDKDDQRNYADAIVGVTLHPKVQVVYLRSKVLEESARANDWTYQEAVEWYDFNTVRSLDYEKPEDNPPLLVDDIDV
jgi:hypothetical protein